MAPRHHLLLLASLLPLTLSATQGIPDKYPDSILYDRPQEVVPGVWSAIGATAPPDYDNAGHNNNLSFVVTSDGVLVVNGGASYLLAKALHQEIQAITDQPVRLVVDENGQGHAMLGNSYWREQGVEIIAHRQAAEEFEAHGAEILADMQRYNRDRAEGTFVAVPDRTFDEREVIQMGDTRIELLWLGPAHSPGDILVWVPQRDVIITGDMAFHQRMLPVFEDTDTAGWLESWDRFAAMNVTHVIPGHGEPTDMEQVTRYTRDYLRFLREQVQALLDEGKGLHEAYQIDQSQWSQLDTYEELAGKNAGRVFQQMEFEF